MLGKKQDQKVAENSSAIQAGGNVTVNNGLSVAEVRELCLLFLRDNFPALREEAIREAEDNVREFAQELELKIVQNAQFITLEKFKDPDVQAAINDAVQSSARRGKKANTNVLVDLISERASVSSSDFKDIVVSEAVNVVPKLTQEQISYLSFIHFMTHCGRDGLRHVSQLEPVSLMALNAVSAGFGISDSQKRHIQFAGTCSIMSMMHIDIYDGWINSLFKGLGYTDKDKFKSDVAQFSPSTKRLLEEFDKDSKGGQVTLTSVGQAIAIANLSKSLGRLDYSIWIK
ncbi:LPO_1073/Vpar_1526 family protein [Salinimonas chungwhensis]|uniref:LPO_1073/Vpar_1526 family protein n=1 Tax=Salinimonas chungwhensis TaxID=265425 RepID=UPI000366BEC5|nr:LPO_1073/Vpar_1526 family protein [Salinimonas chungwhensis]